MTQTLPPGSGLPPAPGGSGPLPTSGGSPPAPVVSRRLGLGAAGCAVAGGILAVAAGPLIALAAIGVLALAGMFAAAVYRPVFATYGYSRDLPLLGGPHSA